MYKSIRYFSLLLAAYSSAAAAQTLNGDWTGAFSCQSFTDAKFTLTAAQDQGEVISGTLSFEYTDGRSLIKGSHKVSGRGDAREFTLRATDWVERPAKSTPFSLSGRARLGGAAIEVKFEECGREIHAASNAQMVASYHHGAASEPIPPTDNWPAGMWRGEIGCGTNSKNRSTRKAEILIIEDDSRLLADLSFVVPGRRKGDAEIEQRVFLTGARDGDAIILEAIGELNDSGLNARVQSMILQGQGKHLQGELKAKGCSTIGLEMVGSRPAVEIDDGLHGHWLGAGGRSANMAASLEIARASSGDYAQLRLSGPADRPFETRSVLHLLLMPLATLEGRLLLVPVGERLRDFASDQRGKQTPLVLSGYARGHGIILSSNEHGQIDLVALKEVDYLDGAVRETLGRVESDRLLTLGPAGAESVAILGQGETPPQVFPATLQGPLVTAISREAQCKILNEWLQAFVAGKDLRGTTIDRSQRGLVEAFTDTFFVPVFGAPLSILSPQERQSLKVFMREDCGRGQGMEDVSFVGVYIIGHDAGYRAMVARLVDISETRRWLATARAEIVALPDTTAALERIEAIRAEMKPRVVELNGEESSDLEDLLTTRGQSIRAALLKAEIDAELTELLRGTVDNGAFEAISALARKIAAEDIARQNRTEMMSPLRAAARAMADVHLAKLTTGLAQIPSSLAGLAEVRRRIASSLPVLESMSANFSIHLQEVTKPLFDRRNAIEEDPSVLIAFAALLNAVPVGPDIQAATKKAALPYFDEYALSRRPEFGAVYTKAMERAELLSLRMVDLSEDPTADEPTVQDVAVFVLSRVRDINTDIAAMEDDCFSGGPKDRNDPIAAMNCLTLPSVVFGQKGFKLVVLSVTKVSCAAKDHGYHCYLKQEIDFTFPDKASGQSVSLTGPLLNRISALEVQDAIFIRSGSGWRVIWGDLN